MTVFIEAYTQTR